MREKKKNQRAASREEVLVSVVRFSRTVQAHKTWEGEEFKDNFGGVKSAKTSSKPVARGRRFRAGRSRRKGVWRRYKTKRVRRARSWWKGERRAKRIRVMSKRAWALASLLMGLQLLNTVQERIRRKKAEKISLSLVRTTQLRWKEEESCAVFEKGCLEQNQRSRKMSSHPWSTSPAKQVPASRKPRIAALT